MVIGLCDDETACVYLMVVDAPRSDQQVLVLVLFEHCRIHQSRLVRVELQVVVLLLVLRFLLQVNGFEEGLGLWHLPLILELLLERHWR